MARPLCQRLPILKVEGQIDMRRSVVDSRGMRRGGLAIAAMLVTVLCGTGAAAQTQSDPPPPAPAPTAAAAAVGAATEGALAPAVVYKKKTVIDLTAQVIEGELTRPDANIFVTRKVSRFSNMIALRDNFIPELLASPDQL